jgi:leader peptidase (prepilin peptidase)/N-methyltransferase
VIHADYFIILAGLFVLGSVIGSWLNVCIHRLPEHENVLAAWKSIVHPPSHCPRCRQRIAWYDNIPMLGWMRLQGRCRHCRGKIAARYPLVELLTALLFVVVYLCEIPPTYPPEGGTLAHPFSPLELLAGNWSAKLLAAHARYVLHMILLCGLIVAAFIDFDLRIIPDSVTLPVMLFGLAANTLLGDVFLVPLWYQPRGTAGLLLAILEPLSALVGTGQPGREFPGWVLLSPHWHGLAVSLAGLAVGGAAVWSIRLVGRFVLKREAMGFGDVVLLAAIGSVLGWQAALAVFFLAPVLAVASLAVTWFFSREREIPYGPYLSAAALALLCGFPWIWPQVELMALALGPLLPAVALVMLPLLALLLALSQWVKRRLGIVEEVEPQGDWLPGDQLAYLAAENTDDRQGQWRPHHEWSGRLTGRGLAQFDAWRNGSASAAGQAHFRGWP